MASWGVGKTKLWNLIKEKTKKAENDVDIEEERMVNNNWRCFDMPDSFVRLYAYMAYSNKDIDDLYPLICDEKQDRITSKIVLLPVLSAFTPLLLLLFGKAISTTMTAIISVLIVAVCPALLLCVFFLPLSVCSNIKILEHKKADAKEVWIRLHGYDLNPIDVVSRVQSPLSILLLIRVAVLILYWIVIKIPQLIVFTLFFLYGICSGTWKNPFYRELPTGADIKHMHKKHIFIDFNAWVYDGTDVLWASLMLEVLKEVKAAYPRSTYEIYRLKRKLAEADIKRGDSMPQKKEKRERALKKFCVIYFLFLGLFVGLVCFTSILLFSSTTPIVDGKKYPPGQVLAFSVSTIGLIGTLSNFFFTLVPIFCVNPKKELLTRAMYATGAKNAKHDFSDSAGFMKAVRDEVDALSDFLQSEPVIHKRKNSNQRVFRMPQLSICVDDLDRCDSKTIGEVLRAVVLLLEGKGEITFWLAIDPQIVVAAINEDRGDFMKNTGVDGADFLDKIIQLPFCIPRMDEEKKIRLMKNILAQSGESPSWHIEENLKKLHQTMQEINIDIAEDTDLKKLQEFKEEEFDSYFKECFLTRLGARDEYFKLITLARRPAERDLRFLSRLGDIENRTKTVPEQPNRKWDPRPRLPREVKRSLKIPIVNDQEWIWIRDIAKHLPQRARKLKKIFNIYNVARDVLEKNDSKTWEDRNKKDLKFRRKLIKVIVLAEMWPKKLAWIFQVAGEVLDADYSRKKGEAWENGMQLHKLVRELLHKETALPPNEEEFSTEGEEVLQQEKDVREVFGNVSLDVIYREIAEPLMHSVQSTGSLSRHDVDIWSFETLLKEEDETLKDRLLLSDIYPLDYGFMFEEPSLRKFLFNMPGYHLDEVSCALSKITIHVNDSKTSTNPSFTWERKSEFYSTKPKD